MSRYNRRNYGYGGGQSNVSEDKIRRDFMNYVDPNGNKISVDGYEKMGKTLGIDIYTDIFMTYFVYKCGSNRLEYITEDEYVNGLKAFNCNSLNEVRSKITNVREELLVITTENFRKFYNFLFDLNVQGTETEKKKKRISFDAIEIYFNSLFTNQFPIVGEFLIYLKEKKVGLIWDEWRTFLDFVQNEGIKFPEGYSVASYYPVIVDEFYYWYCKKHGIKIPDPEEEF